MSDKKKQIDHEYTDEIVCPHCGYEFGDSWEYDEDDGEMIECQDCDKSFRLDVNYTVSYVSSKVEKEDTP